MSARDADIQEIVRSVAQAFFACEARTVDDATNLMAGNDLLTGCVTIGGGWNGAVTVAFSRSFARAVATQMFGVPSESVSDEEVRDAIGEIVNVLGGNFKSLVATSEDEPGVLSLPVVTNGALGVPGAVVSDRLWFIVGSEPLCLTVFERTEGRASRQTTSDLQHETGSMRS